MGKERGQRQFAKPVIGADLQGAEQVLNRAVVKRHGPAGIMAHAGRIAFRRHGQKRNRHILGQGRVSLLHLHERPFRIDLGCGDIRKALGLLRREDAEIGKFDLPLRRHGFQYAGAHIACIDDAALNRHGNVVLRKADKQQLGKILERIDTFLLHPVPGGLEAECLRRDRHEGLALQIIKRLDIGPVGAGEHHRAGLVFMGGRTARIQGDKAAYPVAGRQRDVMP